MSASVRSVLTASRVRLGVTVSDWRDAVRQVGRLMVETGTVEPRYVDAMIASCERFGPYIVIAPGLALPHSAPEDGALADSLALITLTDPVEFGNEDNDPVRVVIALSAVDRGAHLEQLRGLSHALQTISSQHPDWAPIVDAPSPEHVVALLSPDNEDVENQ